MIEFARASKEARPTRKEPSRDEGPEGIRQDQSFVSQSPQNKQKHTDYVSEASYYLKRTKLLHVTS